MATKIHRMQGDLEPDLRLKVVTHDGSKFPACFPRDITDLTVRGLFYKLFEKRTTDCAGSAFFLPENAIFYRDLVKVPQYLMVASSVAAPIADEAFDPTAQPGSAQKIRVLITGFVAAGTLTITGTDADDQPLTEALAVSADGTLTTTNAFRSVDEDGFVVSAGAAEFTFRPFVYDGRVDLVWEDGDLAEVGDFGLILELIDSGDETETSDPDNQLIEIRVNQKIPYPKPTLVSLDAATYDVGDTITITGKNLLRAVSATLVNTMTQAETDLDNFTLVSGTSITGDVPAALDGGSYQLYVTGPGGDSNLLGPIVVLPIVTSFSPTSLSPGDTLTVDGEGFTGATAIEIVDEDGVATALVGLVVVSDLQVTGDIPGAQALGEYRVRVVLPANQSTLVGTLTIE